MSPLLSPGSRGPLSWVRSATVVLAFAAIAVLPGHVHGAEAEAQAELLAGTMEAKMAACTACHGAQGKPGPDAYYPRIAGKPAGYLYNQLINFRDGKRTYPPMQIILQNLSDEYLRDMAEWFAEQHPSYAAPVAPQASAAMLERGRVLALEGDAAARIPACVACHGSRLTGLEPAIPGLLGLTRDYIVSQFGGWRNGMRAAAEPDCMGEIAQRMQPEDVAAVAVWLSAQRVPDAGRADPFNPNELPMECGTHTVKQEPVR